MYIESTNSCCILLPRRPPVHPTFLQQTRTSDCCCSGLQALSPLAQVPPSLLPSRLPTRAASLAPRASPRQEGDVHSHRSKLKYPSFPRLHHYWTLPLLDLIRSIQHSQERPRPIAAAPLGPQTTRTPDHQQRVACLTKLPLANESGQPAPGTSTTAHHHP